MWTSPRNMGSKFRSARQSCENANWLTEMARMGLKVLPVEFDHIHPDVVIDLDSLAVDQRAGERIEALRVQFCRLGWRTILVSIKTADLRRVRQSTSTMRA